MAVKEKGLDEMIASVGTIGKNMDRLITEVLLEGAKVLIKDIKKKAPKDTGEYAESWVIQKVKAKSVIVGTSKNALWKWLEFGTARHFIAPSKKSALMWGNGKYFSRGHFVSGITAVPHTRPAMKKLPPKLYDIVQKKVKKHFKPFA